MQVIFSLAGKKIAGIRGRVCGTKSWKKVTGKVQPRGAQGSIELNINSSLCFGKNSHVQPPILVQKKSEMRPLPVSHQETEYTTVRLLKTVSISPLHYIS